MKLSLPVFVGSLTTTIVYTGFSLATRAAKLTTDIGLSVTESVLGVVGGPWIQIPFTAVRTVAQPVTEATIQLATLGASMATGLVIGGAVYVGEKLYTKTRAKSTKIEDLANNAVNSTSDIL